MPAYRHTANFVADWRPHCHPIDRNTRAKIMALAEGLERRTKRPGRRNGVLSVVGIIVLRALLYRYLNASTGLLCPSYEAMRRHTGLCKASIANALARLERTGVLKIVRRLVRQRITRTSHVTGLPEQIVTTTQATSLYAVRVPAAYADHLSLPPARPTPFPSRRQMDMLERAQLSWTVEPSLRDRVKQQTPGSTLANLMSPWRDRAASA